MRAFCDKNSVFTKENEEFHKWISATELSNDEFGNDFDISFGMFFFLVYYDTFKCVDETEMYLSELSVLVSVFLVGINRKLST